MIVGQHHHRGRTVDAMITTTLHTTTLHTTTQQNLTTVPFGTTGMDITRVGFGAWAVGGGDWAFAWGPQDDNDSIAAIHKAIDLGINWIDTAAVYGLGHSEEVVARALKTASKKPYV